MGASRGIGRELVRDIESKGGKRLINRATAGFSTDASSAVHELAAAALKV